MVTLSLIVSHRGIRTNHGSVNQHLTPAELEELLILEEEAYEGEEDAEHAVLEA